jgi:outer membrane protein OmpA-like peptidoglycan-associated protein
MIHGRLSRALGTMAMITGLTTGLAGCNKVNKGDYDAVMRENQELRDRMATEQQGRQEAETRSASLEQENRDYAARMDQNRGGTTAARPTKGGAGGDTGFTSEEGVEAYRRGSDVVVSIAGDVLFDSGKANLKSTAKKTLDHVASTIKGKYSGQTIRVEGYTDTDPLVKTKDKWGTNERLSGERALAVEEYLVGKGLSKDQIYYAGFGSARPKANKKDSRRVEIVILGRG